MVRLISGPWILAVLGLAGLAMAQDDLIVDPWRRAVAAAVGEKRTLPPVTDRVAPRPVGVASFPIEEPKSKPAVVPIGPPLNQTKDPWAVVPVGPATDGEIFDPWATTPASARDSNHLVAARAGRSDWAFEINEIVDPWSKGPLAAVTDPLIVDPWAR